MTKGEYIAVNEATKEAMWIKKFIIDLGVVPNIDGLVEIFGDNDGAFTSAKELKDHKRTKHIFRKYHYLLKLVE